MNLLHSFDDCSFTEQIKFDYSMAKHCTLRAGGKTKIYFTPKKNIDLINFLVHNAKSKNPLAIYLTGLGSNLLVRDGGFNGAIISTKFLKDYQINKDIISVQSGLANAKLAKICDQLGYDNLRFLVGIPGNIGGSLAMNAGCHQQNIWDALLDIEIIDNQGNIHHFKKEDFKIGYRKIIFPLTGAILSARFVLKKQNRDSIAYFLNWRNSYQPIDKPNCGSVFKNAKTISAGELIDKAGLKNYRIGDAMISPKHANFIINCGSATASDIEQLIKLIQKKIMQQFKLKLETELVIIGKAAKNI